MLNQITDVDEVKLNKPFHPVPPDLVTFEGARYHLIAFKIIFPTVTYFIGGLPLLRAFFFGKCDLLLIRFLTLVLMLYTRIFSAFGAWIILSSPVIQ